jgi:hypothetical protein
MALVWGDEADSAMSVLAIVPVDEAFDPRPRGVDGFEGLAGVRRDVFEGAKERLRIGLSLLTLGRLATKEIKGARGRERWQYTLAHLMAGTGNVDGFGEIFIDGSPPDARRSLACGHRQADREGRLLARRRERLAEHPSARGEESDRVREHYSTVTPDEQRRSIGNVVNLFGPRKSGEGSGEGGPASGEGQQKGPGR